MKNRKTENKDIDGVKSPSVKVKRNLKRHKGWYTAFMAVVHALGVGAIVGLSVALYFSQDKIEMQVKYQNQMESVYARAYYNLLDGVNDIDTTMAKLTVAKSREKQEALLYEVWCASTLAEEYLATFENQDEGVRTAVKFVNQLGDYSLYLAGKLSKGEGLSEEDRLTLKKMKPLADALKESLKKVSTDLDQGKMFLEDNGVIDNFASAFSAFSEPDFDYPEMIYDGPFSDSLETITARGLDGEEITYEQGEQIIFENLSYGENTEYSVGDKIPFGKFNTLAIINTRNQVLNDSAFSDFATIPFVNSVDGEDKHLEYEMLETIFDSILSTQHIIDNTYLLNIYYPCASYCYGYAPYKQLKTNHVLDERFRTHKWWLPSFGELIRLGYFMNASKNITEENKELNIFGPILDKVAEDTLNPEIPSDKKLKFKNPTEAYKYASSTEVSSGYVWLLDIYSDDGSYRPEDIYIDNLTKDYPGSRAIRPICMF
jgi:hypothetical protein